MTHRMVLLLGLVLALQPFGTMKASTDDAARLELFVTVVDQSERPVGDLTADDFEVYDDGTLQPIASLDRQTRPLNVVLMVDTSGTMKPVLALAKRAANEFLTHLRPGDRAAACGFDNRMTCYPGTTMTTNVDAVRNGLGRLQTGFPSAPISRGPSVTKRHTRPSRSPLVHV